MKIIKNILLCVIAVIAQANFCRADAQQQDDDKKIQVIEDQQSNEAVESDKVVENAPYITKSTMLTIAAGMLVVAVGWRFFADYYGVFPSCLGEVVPRPNQPSNNDGNNDDNDESSASQNSDQFIAQSMSEPVGTNDQEDAWGAQYEREADNERAERQARKEAGVEPHFLNKMVTDWRFKVYQDGLTKFAEENYPDENDASDVSDHDSMPELEDIAGSAVIENLIVDRTSEEIASFTQQRADEEDEKLRTVVLSSKLFNRSPSLKTQVIDVIVDQAIEADKDALIDQVQNKINELKLIEDEIQRLKEQQEQD